MSDTATTKLSDMGDSIGQMSLDQAQQWMIDWIDDTWMLSSQAVKVKHKRDVMKKKTATAIQQYCWNCALAGLASERSN